jgi:hypothetical protein
MKFTKLAEVNDFLKLVDSCKGEVWLESVYGDKYVLTSVLSHYIAKTVLLVEHGHELELFCQLQEDEQLFFEYFNKHPNVNT